MATILHIGKRFINLDNVALVAPSGIDGVDIFFASSDAVDITLYGDDGRALLAWLSGNAQRVPAQPAPSADDVAYNLYRGRGGDLGRVAWAHIRETLALVDRLPDEWHGLEANRKHVAELGRLLLIEES